MLRDLIIYQQRHIKRPPSCVLSGRNALNITGAIWARRHIQKNKQTCPYLRHLRLHANHSKSRHSRSLPPKNSRSLQKHRTSVCLLSSSVDYQYSAKCSYIQCEYENKVCESKSLSQTYNLSDKTRLARRANCIISIIRTSRRRLKKREKSRGLKPACHIAGDVL